MSSIRFYTATVLLFLGASCAVTKPTENTPLQLSELQSTALESELAWEILESLTTEVGARMPGTAKDAEAVVWMQNKFKQLGFDKIWLEPVTFPNWVRGTETLAMVSPFTHDLIITGLGGSPSTKGQVQAEVVEFKTLEELKLAPIGSLDGKIAYISYRMQRKPDGSGYGPARNARSLGPFVAAEKGAVALLIRSIGTDSTRFPHTGSISGSQKGEPVAAAALSNSDADLLSLTIARGKPVELLLEIGSGYQGSYTSHNVIAEITGSEVPREVVIVGGHLDSWDMGTGANDDASGIAITTAAARLVADKKRPRRSIWVVAYANEEQGLYGAKAFAKAHAHELDRFILGNEADFGAGRANTLRVNVREEAMPAVNAMAAQLAPLGIKLDLTRKASGSADIGRLRAVGVPVVDVGQDGSQYFDWHHTDNDTLDKIDPETLAQNVAVRATIIDFVANSDTVFGPISLSK